MLRFYWYFRVWVVHAQGQFSGSFKLIRGKKCFSKHPNIHIPCQCDTPWFSRTVWIEKFLLSEFWLSNSTTQLQLYCCFQIFWQYIRYRSIYNLQNLQISKTDKKMYRKYCLPQYDIHGYNFKYCLLLQMVIIKLWYFLFYLFYTLLVRMHKIVSPWLKLVLD